MNLFKKLFGKKRSSHNIHAENQVVMQKSYDELWGQAIDYYNAKDYIRSLEVVKEIETLISVIPPNVYELIATNAFLLGDFELAIRACASVFAKDSKSQNASAQFVNVWMRIQRAAAYMIEKNEDMYEVPFPKVILTKQKVIDLLNQLKRVDASIYTIGLQKIEELQVKLSLSGNDLHTRRKNDGTVN